jgi:predicted Fe-S protein YdhL (DUF1289 family)
MLQLLTYAIVEKQTKNNEYFSRHIKAAGVTFHRNQQHNWGHLSPPSIMTAIHLTDLEAAINYWREREPSPDGVTLTPAVRALAEVYARMVFHRVEMVDVALLSPTAWTAWVCWYDTTPDAPCIAICTTSQGDAVCKGCGRTDDEVQHWTAYGPVEKRAVWHRIQADGTAWRFNRYAERALESSIKVPPSAPR